MAVKDIALLGAGWKRVSAESPGRERWWQLPTQANTPHTPTSAENVEIFLQRMMIIIN